MMHYFLGMEVWQNVDGISLGQGMMDRKAMSTPMESNLELLSDASSNLVDATMYRQMICSLMYLMNTRPDICFNVNTLRHVHLMIANHAVMYLKGTLEYGLKYDMN